MDIRTLSLNIDEQTYKQIQQKAAEQGSDTEQIIVQMVQQAMGRLIAAQEQQGQQGQQEQQGQQGQQEQQGQPISNSSQAASPAASIEGSTVPTTPTDAQAVLAQVNSRRDFFSDESAQAVAQAQAEAERIVAQAHAHE